MLSCAADASEVSGAKDSESHVASQAEAPHLDAKVPEASGGSRSSPSILRRGFMMKRGGLSMGVRSLKRWCQRFFVLDSRSRALRYYHNARPDLWSHPMEHSASAPQVRRDDKTSPSTGDSLQSGLFGRGSYDLTKAAVQVLLSPQEHDAPTQHAFMLTTRDGETEVFATATIAERNMWVAALQKVAADDDAAELSSSCRNLSPRVSLRLNVLLAAAGDVKDVGPFILLGSELVRAGHRVRIVTHNSYREASTNAGLEFFPIMVSQGSFNQFMAKLCKPSAAAAGGKLGTTQHRVADIWRGNEDMSQIFYTLWCAAMGYGSDTDEQHGAKKTARPPSPSVSRPKAVAGGSLFMIDLLIASPLIPAHVHVAQALGVPMQLVVTPGCCAGELPQITGVDGLCSSLWTQVFKDAIASFREGTPGLRPLRGVYASNLGYDFPLFFSARAAEAGETDWTTLRPELVGERSLDLAEQAAEAEGLIASDGDEHAAALASRVLASLPTHSMRCDLLPHRTARFYLPSLGVKVCAGALFVVCKRAKCNVDEVAVPYCSVNYNTSGARSLTSGVVSGVAVLTSEGAAAVSALTSETQEGWKAAGVVGALSGLGRTTIGSTMRLAGSAAIMTDNVVTGFFNTVSSLSGVGSQGAQGNVIGYADAVDVSERQSSAGPTPLSLLTLETLSSMEPSVLTGGEEELVVRSLCRLVVSADAESARDLAELLRSTQLQAIGDQAARKWEEQAATAQAIVDEEGYEVMEVPFAVDAGSWDIDAVAMPSQNKVLPAAADTDVKLTSDESVPAAPVPPPSSLKVNVPPASAASANAGTPVPACDQARWV